MAAADLFDDTALDGARLSSRLSRHMQPRFLRDARWTAATLSFAYALCAVACNAFAPCADRLHRYTQFPRNYGIRVALVCP